MRYIFLDTETTGLDPSTGHRIVEIGGVELVDRRLTRRKFHTYLNPDRAIDEGAQAVHGLSVEFLADHPRFPERCEEFLDFVRGAHILIHNAPFDVRFLDAELKRMGLPPFSTHCASVIDTLMQARELHPGKRNSLDALCDRYGISNKHRTLHGALLDSELLAEVWLAMTRGQNSLVMEPEGEAGESDGAGGLLEPVALDISALAAVTVSDDEEAAHEAYLAGLDKDSGGPCVWRKREASA